MWQFYIDDINGLLSALWVQGCMAMLTDAAWAPPIPIRNVFQRRIETKHVISVIATVTKQHNILMVVSATTTTSGIVDIIIIIIIFHFDWPVVGNTKVLGFNHHRAERRISLLRPFTSNKNGDGGEAGAAKGAAGGQGGPFGNAWFAVRMGAGIQSC